MKQRFTIAALLLFSVAAFAQASTMRPQFTAFDVATVKPVEHDTKSGRYIKMLDPHRFVAKAYTLKLLIAAAYEISPRAISGGPSWVESDVYDITAITPGETRPTRAEQMTMLRALIAERFKLTFHREQKVFSIYKLDVAKSGPKLKPSTAPPDEPFALISTVYPQKIVLPARNATMGEFASMLQRALLDRPVVDSTGLAGRYDFDLEWAPDETQLNGDVPVASGDAPSPPLFTAVQEQLGLRLEPTRGPISALVVDSATKPSAD